MWQYLYTCFNENASQNILERGTDLCVHSLADHKHIVVCEVHPYPVRKRSPFVYNVISYGVTLNVDFCSIIWPIIKRYSADFWLWPTDL